MLGIISAFYIHYSTRFQPPGGRFRDVSRDPIFVGGPNFSHAVPPRLNPVNTPKITIITLHINQRFTMV
jgi:hypothetical protein